MVRCVCPVVGLCLILPVCGVHAEDRDTAAALIASAEKSLKGGDQATAKAMCERALNSDRTFPVAHFTLGQVLEAMNQPRDAIKSYQTAAELAKKENNTALASRALEAAKKLGPGLVEIGQADQKLADRMFMLGEKALADEQLDTAKAAYTAVLALNPNHDKAKENLAQTEKAIEARGDPVKAKIAAAALSEVWYNVSIGKKDEATKLATDLKDRFSDTPAGKESGQLLACNFDLSKSIKDDLAMAKRELAERQKKLAARPAAPAKTTDVKGPALANRVDVDGFEKLALEEAKKLPNDRLVAAFQDYVTKGKGFYAKATPGTEGNQQNLALALEQFIRCEAVFLRLDEQNLLSEQIRKDEEQASMLRYACMKMTILQH